MEIVYFFFCLRFLDLSSCWNLFLISKGNFLSIVKVKKKCRIRPILAHKGVSSLAIVQATVGNPCNSCIRHREKDKNMPTRHYLPISWEKEGARKRNNRRRRRRRRITNTGRCWCPTFFTHVMMSIFGNFLHIFAHEKLDKKSR